MPALAQRTSAVPGQRETIATQINGHISRVLDPSVAIILANEGIQPDASGSSKFSKETVGGGVITWSAQTIQQGGARATQFSVDVQKGHLLVSFQTDSNGHLRVKINDLAHKAKEPTTVLELRPKEGGRGFSAPVLGAENNLQLALEAAWDANDATKRMVPAAF